MERWAYGHWTLERCAWRRWDAVLVGFSRDKVRHTDWYPILLNSSLENFGESEIESRKKWIYNKHI
ncbi:MAG: hypothetical protein ACPGXL_00135 [Chitinophagales bacterium]